MPTYEYGCPTGHRFEKFYRKISDATGEVACPECGQVATRRMSAGAGLIFKGSGFYITDYGKDGKKSQTPAAASAEGGATTSDTGGGASGESAPSESKSSESTSSESTSGESTSGESTSGESTSGVKPAASKPVPPSSGGSASE